MSEELSDDSGNDRSLPGPTAESLPTGEDIGPTFDLSIFVEPDGLFFQFRCEGRKVEWKAPKTVVHRPHKAMTIDHVFDVLGAGPIVGYLLREAVTNEPNFVMVPRAVNALTDRVMKALRQVQKDHNAEATVNPEETGKPGNKP